MAPLGSRSRMGLVGVMALGLRAREGTEWTYWGNWNCLMGSVENEAKGPRVKCCRKCRRVLLPRNEEEVYNLRMTLPCTRTH